MKYSRVEKYHAKTTTSNKENIIKDDKKRKKINTSKINSINITHDKSTTKRKIKTPIKITIITLLFLFIITFFILNYARKIAIGIFKVNEYNIKSSLITENFHGTKIIHISDIHYGVTINKKLLSELVEEINLSKPDIVVLTGDLFDEKIDQAKIKIKDIENILKKINATYGKYAIKGDNDYNSTWDIVIENSDFININDTFDYIYNEFGEKILISGISSNIKDDSKIEEKLSSSYQELQNNKNIYSILLLHEPDFIDKIDTSKFNLILAGHSLGGEVVLPFIGGTNYPIYSKKYNKNYYKINNSKFFISNGIGTSDLKMRLFNNPSVNLYRLIKK